MCCEYVYESAWRWRRKRRRRRRKGEREGRTSVFALPLFLLFFSLFQVAPLFTVEMLFTVHFAEQWRRGSSRIRRRRRRKGRSRLCFCSSSLSFMSCLYLQKNRKQPDIVFNCVPQTRERSRGGENPASKKNRGEEAALVN